MQIELERILDLQRKYVSTASPEMLERGELVRDSVPDWLRHHASELGTEIATDDFFAEGRDGTGRKTRVPWVRFGSRARSRRATDGFYVVYLFAASGERVYLSLNQGTTDFDGRDFVPKSPVVIEGRVAWARSLLDEWLKSVAGEFQIELGDAGLGSGYERGNVVALAYDRGHVPGEDRLLADARAFARGLGVLYANLRDAPLPGESPELAEAFDAAERSSGRAPGSKAGFRTDAAEIKVVERHAVRVAIAYYEADGWTVKELGKPYDLEIRKRGIVLTVEVKGTTSEGMGVPLTANEVLHHSEAYPGNALVVVRGIRLDRTGSHPVASGGTLHELRGWKIDPAALRPISYGYAVPAELYADDGVPASDLVP